MGHKILCNHHHTSSDDTYHSEINSLKLEFKAVPRTLKSDTSNTQPLSPKLEIGNYPCHGISLVYR